MIQQDNHKSNLILLLPSPIQAHMNPVQPRDVILTGGQMLFNCYRVLCRLLIPVIEHRSVVDQFAEHVKRITDPNKQQAGNLATTVATQIRPDGFPRAVNYQPDVRPYDLYFDAVGVAKLFESRGVDAGSLLWLQNRFHFERGTALYIYAAEDRSVVVILATDGVLPALRALWPSIKTTPKRYIACHHSVGLSLMNLATATMRYSESEIVVSAIDHSIPNTHYVTVRGARAETVFGIIDAFMSLHAAVVHRGTDAIVKSITTTEKPPNLETVQPDRLIVEPYILPADSVVAAVTVVEQPASPRIEFEESAVPPPPLPPAPIVPPPATIKRTVSDATLPVRKVRARKTPSPE